MSSRPALSTERKLEVREHQLREAVTRGAMNEAKNVHNLAASALASTFNSLAVSGFTLSPDTLEYAATPEPDKIEDVQPVRNPSTKK